MHRNLNSEVKHYKPNLFRNNSSGSEYSRRITPNGMYGKNTMSSTSSSSSAVQHPHHQVAPPIPPPVMAGMPNNALIHNASSSDQLTGTPPSRSYGPTTQNVGHGQYGGLGASHSISGGDPHPPSVLMSQPGVSNTMIYTQKEHFRQCDPNRRHSMSNVGPPPLCRPPNNMNRCSMPQYIGCPPGQGNDGGAPCVFAFGNGGSAPSLYSRGGGPLHPSAVVYETNMKSSHPVFSRHDSYQPNANRRDAHIGAPLPAQPAPPLPNSVTGGRNETGPSPARRRTFGTPDNRRGMGRQQQVVLSQQDCGKRPGISHNNNSRHSSSLLSLPRGEKPLSLNRASSGIGCRPPNDQETSSRGAPPSAFAETTSLPEQVDNSLGRKVMLQQHPTVDSPQRVRKEVVAEDVGDQRFENVSQKSSSGAFTESTLNRAGGSSNQKRIVSEGISTNVNLGQQSQTVQYVCPDAPKATGVRTATKQPVPTSAIAAKPAKSSATSSSPTPSSMAVECPNVGGLCVIPIVTPYCEATSTDVIVSRDDGCEFKSLLESKQSKLRSGLTDSLLPATALPEINPRHIEGTFFGKGNLAHLAVHQTNFGEVSLDSLKCGELYLKWNTMGPHSIGLWVCPSCRKQQSSASRDLSHVTPLLCAGKSVRIQRRDILPPKRHIGVTPNHCLICGKPKRTRPNITPCSDFWLFVNKLDSQDDDSPVELQPSPLANPEESQEPPSSSPQEGEPAITGEADAHLETAPPQNSPEKEEESSLVNPPSPDPDTDSDHNVDISRFLSSLPLSKDNSPVAPEGNKTELPWSCDKVYMQMQQSYKRYPHRFLQGMWEDATSIQASKELILLGVPVRNSPHFLDEVLRYIMLREEVRNLTRRGNLHDSTTKSSSPNTSMSWQCGGMKRRSPFLTARDQLLGSSSSTDFCTLNVPCKLRRLNNSPGAMEVDSGAGVDSGSSCSSVSDFGSCSPASCIQRIHHQTCPTDAPSGSPSFCKLVDSTPRGKCGLFLRRHVLLELCKHSDLFVNCAAARSSLRLHSLAGCLEVTDIDWKMLRTELLSSAHVDEQYASTPTDSSSSYQSSHHLGRHSSKNPFNVVVNKLEIQGDRETAPNKQDMLLRFNDEADAHMARVVVSYLVGVNRIFSSSMSAVSDIHGTKYWIQKCMGGSGYVSKTQLCLCHALPKLFYFPYLHHSILRRRLLSVESPVSEPLVTGVKVKLSDLYILGDHSATQDCAFVTLLGLWKPEHHHYFAPFSSLLCQVEQQGGGDVSSPSSSTTCRTNCVRWIKVSSTACETPSSHDSFRVSRMALFLLPTYNASGQLTDTCISAGVGWMESGVDMENWQLNTLIPRALETSPASPSKPKPETTTPMTEVVVSQPPAPCVVPKAEAVVPDQNMSSPVATSNSIPTDQQPTHQQPPAPPTHQQPVEAAVAPDPTPSNVNKTVSTESPQVPNKLPIKRKRMASQLATSEIIPPVFPKLRGITEQKSVDEAPTAASKPEPQVSAEASEAGLPPSQTLASTPTPSQDPVEGNKPKRQKRSAASTGSSTPTPPASKAKAVASSSSTPKRSSGRGASANVDTAKASVTNSSSAKKTSSRGSRIAAGRSVVPHSTKGSQD